MKTARSILFFLWLYGQMTIWTIVGLPTLITGGAPMRWWMRNYIRTVLFGLRWIVGVRVTIRGRDRVPDGPVLVAGKHQAMLDVFLPFLIFKNPVVVMKQELLWYPGLGWFALRAGMIAIKREGTAKTVKKMVTLGKKRVAEGSERQVVIFPEGTRAKPGEKASYHPAGLRAFYKALDVPLVPVATNSGLCWQARGITRHPGHVVYEVLPPIEPGLPYKDMLARVEQDLEAASSILLDEGLAAQGRTRADLS